MPFPGSGRGPQAGGAPVATSPLNGLKNAHFACSRLSPGDQSAPDA